jgi:glycosyltransferase involved in cell wall biosynthesis
MQTIAIDARPLAFPNSGIARYTANILRELALLEVPQRIVLYCDRPFQLGFPMPASWHFRSGTVRTKGLSSLFAQAYFPLWAMKDKIDIFWSPYHHFPFFLPARIRTVITVHDLVWKRYPQTMRRGARTLQSLAAPLSLKKADRIIAVSQFTRGELREFFPSVANKCTVIHEASSLMNTGETCPKSLPNRYFLFVGSNEPRKNLERLLQAYLDYRGGNDNPCDLAIAGSYEWGAFSVEDYVQSRRLETSVHLIRKADDDRIRSLYAHAEAFVMVSLYEGFGLPLVEAMQWGIPLIASNTSAVEEVSGNAAYQVDPLDAAAITQGLHRIAEDRSLREELARNSTLRGKMFSWKQAAIETMAVILGEEDHAK